MGSCFHSSTVFGPLSRARQVILVTMAVLLLPYRAGMYCAVGQICRGHDPRVTYHRDAVNFDVFPQRRQVGRTIRIAIQDEAPVISTLCQVVWHINGNHPSESPHSKETISGMIPKLVPSCHAFRVAIRLLMPGRSSLRSSASGSALRLLVTK